MPRNPARRDAVGRDIDRGEQIRELRLDPGPEATPTWLIGGAVSEGEYLLHFRAGNRWLLIEFRASCRVGSVTIDWLLNENVIYSGHVVPDDGNDSTVTLAAPYVALVRGDKIRPLVVSDDGTAQDLSATAVLVSTVG